MRKIVRTMFTGATISTIIITTSSEAAFPGNPISAGVRQVVSENFPPELIQPINAYMNAASLPTLAITPPDNNPEYIPGNEASNQAAPGKIITQGAAEMVRIKPTYTPTPTMTASPTTQATVTVQTPTPVQTSTPSPTLSLTPSETIIPSPTLTHTSSPTPTQTLTPTATRIPLPTNTIEPTSVPPTAAPSATPVPTNTPISSPTNTLTPSNTPTITLTPTASNTPTPIPTLPPTSTPIPSPLPTNSPPIAVDDSSATLMDTDVTVLVLFNDSDPNDDLLTIISVTQGANGGSVTFSTGDVTFTPYPNYTGTDSFTYTISDGNGGTATATVTITVSP